MSSALYESTKQRLASYGVFSSEVIESIARFATTQESFATYQKYFTAMGVGEVRVHTLPNGEGVPYVDVPATQQPEKGVIVVHTSMGTALDPNQLYQLATIAGTNPGYRVIGFGNPSGDRFYFKQQNLSLWKLLSIAFTRHMRPLVAAELDYLAQQGIQKSIHIGYSYGAMKTVVETGYLEPGVVGGILLVDPVARPRWIGKLVRDFKKTYVPLGKYVNAANLQTYHTARGEAARDRDSTKALLRPINLSIAMALSRVSIMKYLQRVLVRQPQAKVAIAWGTKSELGDDEHMQKSIAEINTLRTDATAIVPIRLKELEHAFANDVHLHAAIIKQFLLVGKIAP